MAVNVFCFYKKEPSEVTPLLERMKSEHPTVFPVQYDFNIPHPLFVGDAEMAAAEGFYDAKATNVIWVANKEEWEVTQNQLADILRQYFADEDILVLSDNVIKI